MLQALDYLSTRKTQYPTSQVVAVFEMPVKPREVNSNSDHESNHESNYEDKTHAETVANVYATTKALCHSINMGVRKEQAV